MLRRDQGGVLPADGAPPADLPFPMLNSEQRAAATADADRPLIVLACAGTGKTTVLVHRAACLLQQAREAV